MILEDFIDFVEFEKIFLKDFFQSRFLAHDLNGFVTQIFKIS
jgi:hypothetical protein